MVGQHGPGFDIPEHANGHLQAFEALFPLGEGYSYTFLQSPSDRGLALKIDVGKSRDVKAASASAKFMCAAAPKTYRYRRRKLSLS